MHVRCTVHVFVCSYLIIDVRSFLRILLSFPPGTRPRFDPHPASTRDRTSSVDLLCAVCISETIFHTILSMTVVINIVSHTLFYTGVAAAQLIPEYRILPDFGPPDFCTCCSMGAPGCTIVCVMCPPSCRK